MIGTTHFTNAVVERKRLLEVAAVRLGAAGDAGAAADGRLARGSARGARPPRLLWCTAATSSTGARSRRSTRTRSAASRPTSATPGSRSIAVYVGLLAGERQTWSSGPRRSSARSFPDAHITLSSEIGRIGLLERENAAIMNACLRRARARMSSARSAARSIDLAITAPLYITQNDGTLMSAEFAEQYPVLTFASGPTNSHARRGVPLRASRTRWSSTSAGRRPTSAC